MKQEETFAKKQAELQQEHQCLVYQNRTQNNEVFLQQLKKNEKEQQEIETQWNQSYQQLVKKNAPKPPLYKNVARAFLIGGLICMLGQIMIEIAVRYFMVEQQTASGLASSLLIVGTAILTGIGIYDEIGRFGGAGSMVPITGFANSIASAALEFKREGMIYGVGAKIFTIAGPVILYGILASVVVGLVAYLGGSL